MTNRFIDPSRKLLYHTDTIAAIKAGKTPPPVNIEIDLSNRCNLACRFCHMAYTHSRGPHAHTAVKPAVMDDCGDLMQFWLAKRIIDEAKAMGVRSFTWTGGGEPTLHPRFDEILSYSILEGLDNGLYTNGTNITEERAALLKGGMKWVYISLDAPDRDAYRALKGVDAFDKARAGIRLLADAAGAAVVGVGFLLNARNWRQGERMIETALSNGADYAQFRPAVDFDPRHPDLGEADAAWISEAVEWLKTLSDRRGVEVDISRFEMYRDWQGHGYPFCYWTQLQATVTPNGKLWRCVNRRGYPGDCLGDLSEETFPDVWKRSGAQLVNEKCRILCRGHIPNRTLRYMLDGRNDEHRNFI